MKLAAIYNVFDSEELLIPSIKCLIDHVDHVIIVWQGVSNFRESYNGLSALIVDNQEFFNTSKISFIKYHPIHPEGAPNEIAKRNLGIESASQKGCTHFLSIDCDEFYHDFGRSLELYKESGKSGSVCRLWTYFKSPTLRLETQEDYFVPFIHELKPETRSGVGIMDYPYYADPTRGISHVTKDDIFEMPIWLSMDHFSWCRKDIHRKIRNSSARYNIMNGTLLDDYMNPNVGPGFYVRDYQRKLISVPDKFNLSSILTG